MATEKVTTHVMKLVFLIVLVLFCGVAREMGAQPRTKAQEGINELIVPLDKTSPLQKLAKKSMAETLSEIRAVKKAAPRSWVCPSGRYVLWGDLFKTGGCFALMETRPQADQESELSGVAFAEWVGGKWELRGLWKIETVWRPKGWKASDGDYLPEPPATQPFELVDLSGDGVSEVVIAGEVGKYFQNHYLLRFSGKKHTLKLVAAAMGKPEVVGPYVRLYSHSPRIAIYVEWLFMKWNGDQLRLVASWHDEDAYSENDFSFAEGKRMGPDGKIEGIRVIYGKGSDYTSDCYGIAQDGQHLGRLCVQWKDEKSRISPRSDEIEKAWLFEKITGLPRKFYPEHEDPEIIPKLEKLAAVKIEGNAEVIKIFRY